MEFTSVFLEQIVNDCSELLAVIDNSTVVTTAGKVTCAKNFIARYALLLQYEGFSFSIHAWEEPDRGRNNIDRINRTKQNLAALHVAAAFLSNKAKRAIDAADAINIVSVADDGVQLNLDSLQVRIDVTSCYPQKDCIRNDVEYMFGIAGGRLENWQPCSSTWLGILGLVLPLPLIHCGVSLVSELSQLDHVLGSFKSRGFPVTFMNDLEVYRSILCLCIASNCNLVIEFDGRSASIPPFLNSS